MVELWNAEQVAHHLGMSKRHVRCLVAEGKFPEPLRLSPRRTRWPREAVEGWQASRDAKTKLEPRRSPAEAERLVEENVALVWLVLRRFRHLGSDRDDLESAALVALWRAAELYDEDAGAFSTYACKVIWRALLHRQCAAQTRRRRQCVHCRDWSAKGEHQRSSQPSPPALLIRAEEEAHVEHLLACLPPSYAYALRRLMDGARQGEVAQEMRVTTTAVGNYRRRAAERLGERLPRCGSRRRVAASA